MSRDDEDDLTPPEALPLRLVRSAPLRWICLVHGVIGCRCGSRDVAPFGGGEFHRWSRPRPSDIWVDLSPRPEPKPGAVVQLVKTATEPGAVFSRRGRRRGA